MKVAELQSAFLNNLRLLLPGWRFVSSTRQFHRTSGQSIWHFHIGCINHPADFDATGDVAVEFISNRARVAIVGASLANIEGTGQSRHSVASLHDCAPAAASLVQEFHRVGVPFLERYSDPLEALRVLRAGGTEARLISPIDAIHDSQITALMAFTQAV